MKGKKIDGHIVAIILLLIALCIYVFGFQYIEDWVYDVWPFEIGIVAKYSLPKLTLQFLEISIIACACSAVIGVALGIFCFTELGESFGLVIEKTSMIVQTIPAMAVLMFGLTAFGIGMKAAVFALILQSLLPIVFATMAGLGNVPYSYIEVGKGMGMTKGQILRKVQIPMALPVILSGMRTALIICIGAATLAFSTGAGGLGLLIQSGCSTYNTVFIMEGTIPICLIAILMDQILRKVEKHAYRTEG
jgi:osmoprotectant transport system permease protein